MLLYLYKVKKKKGIDNMTNMLDITTMENEDLQSLKTAIDEEIRNRKDAETRRLIQNFCDAFNELASNIIAELWVEVNCEECDWEDEIDVIDYFSDNGKRKLTIDDFRF